MGHVNIWREGIEADRAASAACPLEGEPGGSQWVQDLKGASCAWGRASSGSPGWRGRLAPPSVGGKMPRPKLIDAWRTVEPQRPGWGEAQPPHRPPSKCRHLRSRQSFQKGCWSVGGVGSLAGLTAGNRCQWRSGSRQLDHLPPVQVI